MNLSFGSPPHSSLFEYARRGRVYCAYSTGVTGLAAYTATAIGPVLWNGNRGDPQFKAVILGISVTVTTASAAAVSVGLGWGSLQTAAPTSTTASTLISSTYANGAQPTCKAYKAGTVAHAALGYLPMVTLDTAALTANPMENMWIPLDGLIVVPQNSWVGFLAGATATTSVLDFAIVWAEASE